MVIIIGASGFIGYYAVDELLKRGYDVIATGRDQSSLQYYRDNNITSIELDITNKEDFKKLPSTDIEAVILLASLIPSHVNEDNPFRYVDVNINGTLNVLEYCRTNNIKRLVSCTSYFDVQNLWQKDVYLKDDVPRSFNMEDYHATYIISKNAASDLILHYNASYGMNGAIFRLPGVLGVGPHSTIYLDGKLHKSGTEMFIEKAMHGEPIEIYGNKDIIRDNVYVKDVVSAIVGIIKSPTAKGLYNISSGVGVTLDEHIKSIVEVFSEAKNKSTITYRPEIQNISNSYLFDISKAKNEFNYTPKFTSIKDLLLDYKKELKNSQIMSFFEDKIKE